MNRLAWPYTGNRLLRRWSRGERRIAFRFAPPVGALRLTVRDNQGSDAFILSGVFQHRYYDIRLPSTPSNDLLRTRVPEAAIACVDPMEDNLRLLRRTCHATMSMRR